MQPPPDVLDLFAVPDVVEPLPGGQGASVRAGDLVLSPGRDPGVLDWLAPVLARLAVRLDERPGPRRGRLRVAMPVPSRDGRWVVDGWAATRYEPGTRTCDDLDVTLAAGSLFAAELARAVPSRPPRLADRADRWARAERAAFAVTPNLDAEGVQSAEPGAASSSDASPLHGHAVDDDAAGLVRRLVADLHDPLRDPLHDPLDHALHDTPPDALHHASIGADQLVHADLWGNVLVDAEGAAVVIDVTPAWRPLRWSEAVCVLDAVTWGDADPARMRDWTVGAARRAMLRAALFRLLADDPRDRARTTPAYAAALAPLLHPEGLTAHRG